MEKAPPLRRIAIRLLQRIAAQAQKIKGDFVLGSPRIRSVSPEEEAELDRYLIHGLELLPIDLDKQEGRFVLLAMHMVIEAVRMGEALPAGVSSDDFCAWLGVVWGEEICALYGWSWAYIEFENGFSGACVMSVDQKHCCFPIHAVHAWIAPQKSPNRCLTLFEALESPGVSSMLRVWS